MSQAPKYLTGNPAAINEFLDKFDVCIIPFSRFMTRVPGCK